MTDKKTKSRIRESLLKGDGVGSTWRPTYQPTEFATWRILGEDQNADFGGHHHEPDLGHFTGTFVDAVEYALEQDRFISWGSGGRILKIKAVNRSSLKNKPNTFSVTLQKVYTTCKGNVLLDEEAAKQEDNECTEHYALVTEENVGYLLQSDKLYNIIPMDEKKRIDMEKREAALSKLSDEEKKLLGLK